MSCYYRAASFLELILCCQFDGKFHFEEAMRTIAAGHSQPRFDERGRRLSFGPIAYKAAIDALTSCVLNVLRIHLPTRTDIPE